MFSCLFISTRLKQCFRVLIPEWPLPRWLSSGLEPDGHGPADGGGRGQLGSAVDEVDRPFVTSPRTFSTTGASSGRTWRTDTWPRCRIIQASTSSLISYHLFLNREGCWSSTDDFATSFLHFPCPFPDVVLPPLPLSALSSSPLSLCLARRFWPDLMNGRHDYTTAVCGSLQ